MPFYILILFQLQHSERHGQTTLEIRWWKSLHFLPRLTADDVLWIAGTLAQIRGF
jgi:hypothetical protein